MVRYWFVAPCCVLFLLNACSLSDNQENEGNWVGTGLRDVELKGVAEKGPFITGTVVELLQLDAALKSIGSPVRSQTLSDSGNFETEMSVTDPDPVFELQVEGYFYDEHAQGVSDGQLFLTGIVQPADDTG